jgi:hypothetical protein
VIAGQRQRTQHRQGCQGARRRRHRFSSRELGRNYRGMLSASAREETSPPRSVGHPADVGSPLVSHFANMSKHPARRTGVESERNSNTEARGPHGYFHRPLADIDGLPSLVREARLATNCYDCIAGASRAARRTVASSMTPRTTRPAVPQAPLSHGTTFCDRSAQPYR